MREDTGISVEAGADTRVEASFVAAGSEGAGWLVVGATITSGLNRPYLVEIDLQTERLEADPGALLGAASELRIGRAGLDTTYGGIVSSVRAQGRGDIGQRARVTLEPALTALGHGRDTRIFQDLTVPEVLTRVLSGALAPYSRAVQLELRRDYPKREYTVQYQESHLDFVHRLMEEEGILYRFALDGPVETLILFDAPAQYERIGRPFIAFSDVDGDLSTHGEEHVRELVEIGQIGGTEVATRHFDWTHPSSMITAARAGEGPGPARESYEHDEPLTLHGYAISYQANDAAETAKVRREQQERPQRFFQGRSTVTEMRPGLRFDLTGHPFGLDGDYVVVEARHHLLSHVERAEGIGVEAGGRYANLLTVALAETPWRPLRTRPRPRIHGIQTAIVTGPAGEEIHCDEHGRVKVQFHWDREGAYDEHTSCWVRVMQTAAGTGFGAWVLPRVGWEVVVSFVDGDPDRPLVTGCVYNGERALPYPLPEKKAMTLFKSNSYPGGDGFNELRLDDTKLSEEIWLHGEKDWNTVIKHDLTRQVGNDETQHVARHRTRTVGVNETLTVGADRTRLVGANEVITVNLDRTRVVGANETLTVNANRARTVGGDEAINIAGNVHSAIGKDEEAQVVGDRSASVAGSQTVAVGVNETYRVGKSADRKVGASSNEKVGKMRKRKVGLVEMVNVGVAQMVNVAAARVVSAGLVHMLNAGMVMKLKAGSKLELACGGSKITLTPAGVKITGAQVAVAASGDVTVTGALIHLN